MPATWTKIPLTAGIQTVLLALFPSCLDCNAKTLPAFREPALLPRTEQLFLSERSDAIRQATFRDSSGISSEQGEKAGEVFPYTLRNNLLSEERSMVESIKISFAPPKDNTSSTSPAQTNARYVEGLSPFFSPASAQGISTASDRLAFTAISLSQNHMSMAHCWHFSLWMEPAQKVFLVSAHFFTSGGQRVSLENMRAPAALAAEVGKILARYSARTWKTRKIFKPFFVHDETTGSFFLTFTDGKKIECGSNARLEGEKTDEAREALEECFRRHLSPK